MSIEQAFRNDILTNTPRVNLMLVCRYCQTTIAVETVCCPVCGHSEGLVASAPSGHQPSTQVGAEAPLGDYTELERKVERGSLRIDILGRWARWGAILGGAGWMLFTSAGYIIGALNGEVRLRQVPFVVAFVLISSGFATAVGGALGMFLAILVNPFRQEAEEFDSASTLPGNVHSPGSQQTSEPPQQSSDVVQENR